MEIRQLVFFEAVSRLKNFTHAAEELYISQPGVSASIRKLEVEMGTDLLIRGQGEVTLTEAGETLLRHARLILDSIRDASAQTKAVGRSSKEVIAVGLPPMLGAPVLVPLLRSFGHEDAPAKVQIHELGSHEIRECLRNRQLDLGLVIDDPTADKRAGLSSSPVTTEDVLVGMPKDHPLAAKETINVTDLAQQPLILMYQGAVIRDLVLGMFHTAGIPPIVVHTSTQIESVHRLVANGTALSFFARAISPSLSDIALRPLVPRVSVNVSLLFREERQKTPGFLAVAQFITDKSRQVDTPGHPS